MGYHKDNPRSWRSKRTAACGLEELQSRRNIRLVRLPRRLVGRFRQNPSIKTPERTGPIHSEGIQVTSQVADQKFDDHQTWSAQ